MLFNQFPQVSVDGQLSGRAGMQVHHGILCGCVLNNGGQGRLRHCCRWQAANLDPLHFVAVGDKALSQ